ncbi:MAG: radical SAM protein [Candidatus Sumerlaeia bacterium]|nr:radical SAM protein [Candidatus Sumerlaeia bacterium]
MNHALCNRCKQVVASQAVERDGKVYLAKSCPTCGPTETLISADARRYWNKHALDTGFTYRGCTIQCLGCDHGKSPSIVFIDITNRCNMNCPICVNNTPSDGFSFDPPLEYFEKIFKHFSTFKRPPAMQLFGGEPTVRNDLFDIIELAKSYGLRARILTNGIRLADEDYCRRLVETRVKLLLAYDGCNPEMYRSLRGTEKAMHLKQKALDNIGKIGRGRVTLMTVLSKDYNANELPDFFRFCHERRDYIEAIYFLPLAHTWDPAEWDYQPEQMTTEDLEILVDAAFPNDHIEFLPAAFLSTLRNLMRCLRVKNLPFMGAHPNCESMYLMFSNGEEYVPFSRYLRSSPMDTARALMEAEKRMAARLERFDRSALGRTLEKVGLKDTALFLMGILAVGGVMRRHVNFGAVLKGSGRLGRWYHGVSAVAQMAFGARTRRVLAKHMNIQGALEVLALPLEDLTNIESDRMERCPSAFAYYDPCDDEVRAVPFCAWNTLHRKEALHKVAEFYGTAQAGGDLLAAGGRSRRR